MLQNAEAIITYKGYPSPGPIVTVYVYMEMLLCRDPLRLRCVLDLHRARAIVTLGLLDFAF